MAITTDNGKLAIMEMDVDWEPGLPLSPSSIGQAEQQQLLWGFPEVLWQAESVVSDFFASPLSGNIPLAVTFTDTSTGTPTAWLWDFGDGDTSTDQNPSHVYLTAGTWSVSLTVSNAGSSDELTKTNYIVTSVPSSEPNRVGGGGQGGGPILGYQYAYIDLDENIQQINNEKELLILRERSLILSIKIARQREEDELVYLGVIS